MQIPRCLDMQMTRQITSITAVPQDVNKGQQGMTRTLPKIRETSVLSSGLRRTSLTTCSIGVIPVPPAICMRIQNEERQKADKFASLGYAVADCLHSAV